MAGLARWRQIMSFNRLASLADHLEPHMEHVLRQCNKHGYQHDMYGLFKSVPLSPPYQSLVRSSVHLLLSGGGSEPSEPSDSNLEVLDSEDAERYRDAFHTFANQLSKTYGVQMTMIGDPARTEDYRSVVRYTNRPQGRTYTWTQDSLDVEEDSDLAELLLHMKHSMCQEVRPTATVESASETSIDHPSLGEQVVLRCFYKAAGAGPEAAPTAEEGAGADTEDIPAVSSSGSAQRLEL